MRRPLIVLIAAATMLGVASAALAGGGGHGAVCRGFGDGQGIVMRDSCFEGTGHVVEAGRTIVVTNAGQIPHTLTAADGSFDSGTIEPGSTHRFTIAETGTVPIYCTLHGTADGDGMAGLLVAEPADLTDARPATTAATSVPMWPWAVTVGALIALAAVARRWWRGRTGPEPT